MRLTALVLALVIAFVPQDVARRRPLFPVGGSNPSAGAICTGHVATGDVTCVFSPNLASGSALFIGAAMNGATAATVSGCSATWTVDTFAQDTIIARGATPASGACTVTIHITAGSDSAKTVAGLEIKNTSAAETATAVADKGFIATGNTISSSSITTTATNDLVVGAFMDYNGNGTTFTATYGTIAVQTSRAADVNVAIVSKSEAATGTFTPTTTYDASSSFSAGAGAYKP